VHRGREPRSQADGHYILDGRAADPGRLIASAKISVRFPRRERLPLKSVLGQASASMERVPLLTCPAVAPNVQFPLSRCGIQRTKNANRYRKGTSCNENDFGERFHSRGPFPETPVQGLVLCRVCVSRAKCDKSAYNVFEYKRLTKRGTAPKIANLQSIIAKTSSVKISGKPAGHCTSRLLVPSLDREPAAG